MVDEWGTTMWVLFFTIYWIIGICCVSIAALIHIPEFNVIHSPMVSAVLETLILLMGATHFSIPLALLLLDTAAQFALLIIVSSITATISIITLVSIVKSYLDFGEHKRE